MEGPALWVFGLPYEAGTEVPPRSTKNCFGLFLRSSAAWSRRALFDEGPMSRGRSRGSPAFGSDLTDGREEAAPRISRSACVRGADGAGPGCGLPGPSGPSLFRPRIRLGQGRALPPSFRTCVLQPAQGPAPWSAWTSGLSALPVAEQTTPRKGTSDMSAPQTCTLIGFLGKDREIRFTRERTYTRTVHNEVIDGEEEIEVHAPSRTYMKLSLATHERSASGTATRCTT